MGSTVPNKVQQLMDCGVGCRVEAEGDIEALGANVEKMESGDGSTSRNFSEPAIALQQQPIKDELNEEKEEESKLVIDTQPETAMDDSSSNIIDQSATSVPDFDVAHLMASQDSQSAADTAMMQGIEMSRSESMSSDSCASSLGECDTGSLCGSLSHSEISPNMSGSAVIHSEGSSSARHSLSKSRRKSDRILPLADDSGRENFICPMCREGFSSKHDFTKHIRLHNSPSVTTTSVNTCKLCDKILSSQSSLDRHMLVHSGERPFECRKCGMAFTTNGNMHRHMRIHEKCGLFAEEGFLKDGVVYKPRGKKKKLVPSRPSNEKFSPNADEPSEPKRRRLFLNDFDQFANNSMPSHPELYRTTTTTLFQRQVLNIPTVRPVISVDLDASMIRCPCCNVKLFTIYGIVHHLRKHERERKVKSTYHCSVCNLSWPTISELETHARTVHRKRHLSTKEIMGIVEGAAESKKSGKNSASTSASGSWNPDLTSFEFTSNRFPFMEKMHRENHRQTEKDKSLSHNHANSRDSSSYFVCDECGMCSASSEQSNLHRLMHDAQRVASGSSSADSNLNDVDIQEHMEETEFMLMFEMQAAPSSAPEGVEEDQENTPVVAEQKKEISILKNPKKLQFDANQNVVPTVDPNVVKVFLPSRPVASGSGNFPATVPLSDFAKGNLIQLPLSALQETIFQKALNSIQHNNSILPSLKLAPPLFTSGNLFRALSMAPSGVNSAPAVDVVSLNVAIPGSEAQSGMDAIRILPVPDSTSDRPSVPIPLPVEESYDPRDDDVTPLMENSDRVEDSTRIWSRYTCQQCSENFLNFKSYKAHVRSHQLSSSPFKCEQCSYTSSDKSTLIRHLRTHNGERPFQCLTCAQAFTTKANCERHVRKKHRMVLRDEIDRSIGYSKKTLSEMDAAADDVPASETVCKYCGEDFKGDRALKHHLRSQTSCQHKPYVCKICKIGFSTKANCFRHLQKQHHEIEPSVAENYVLINAELLEAQKKAAQEGRTRDRYSTGQLSIQSIMDLSHSNQELPGYPLQSLIQMSSSTGSADRWSNFRIEPDQTDDQPLDFSLKSGPKILPSSEFNRFDFAVHAGGDVQEDLPMDLSVKASPIQCESFKHLEMAVSEMDPIPSSSNHALLRSVLCSPFSSNASNFTESQFKKLYRDYYNSGTNRYHCPTCGVLFKHGFKLQFHMQSHVSNGSRRDANTSLKKHLRGKQTSQKQFLEKNSTDVSSVKSCTQIHLENNKVTLFEPNNNQPQLVNANILFQPDQKGILIKAVKVPEMPLSIGSTSSEVDLATVSKLLNSAPFQLKFPPPPVVEQMPSTSERPSPSTFQGLVNQRLPVGSPVVEVLAHTIAQRIIQRNEPDEGHLTVDRGRQSKEEAINESSLEQATKKKNSAVKRNSYADSPHKLCCCFCPRAFPWISSLKRHILTHTGQKPFKCPKCTVTFSTKSNRERHMIRKHGLDVHDPATRQMMDRPYKCHLCVFSSFTSSGKLIRHYKEKHPDKDLPENLAMGNTSGFGDPNASFNETNGDGELNSQQDGNDNEEDDDDDEGDVSMDDDGMNEADSIALEMMTAENIAQAAAAAASAVSASHQALASTSLSQQLMNTFNIDPIMANSLMTPGSRLLNVKVTSTIPRPTPSGTPDKHVNPERDNYNVDKITECWKCRKAFDCRKTLLRHLKEHSIDLPFKCYLCDASFDVRLSSLEHKMVSHPSDWSAVQDKNKVGNLKDYSEFMDRIVEDTLAGNTTRRIHEGVELDMKPESDYAQRKVFCSLCPKRFWSLQDLRRHMRSHTGERPFECDVCRARFTLKHSMMRHRRKHTDLNAGGEMHSTSGEDENSSQEDDYAEAEINNPSDHVLLKKENECVFATAEQVQVSDLTLSPAAPDSFMNRSLSEHTDLLQNLLGVKDRVAIDQMLDSPNTAATVLGIHRLKEEASTA